MTKESIQLKRKHEESEKKQQCNKETQVGPCAVVPYLPKDCIFNTIIRLPLESLKTSRFVCKMWYGIVNSPAFIRSHLHRSETGLIVLAPVRYGLPLRPAVFSVESRAAELLSLPVHHQALIDPPPLYYMKFIEIKDGKSTIKDYHTSCMGDIRATCHGLVVLENRTRTGGLILMNTVTREMRPVPLGTRSCHQESYGLVFCRESCLYKLVHLFHDDLRYVDCEIMDIGNGPWRWRAVDGPPSGLFGWLGHEPVFVMRALYWIPNVDHNEYMVSMPLDDEKFVKIPLPSTGGVHDRIIEMDGLVGFVSRQDASRIVVWVLRGLGDEIWEQQYTIGVGFGQNLVPLYCKGLYDEIVFRGTDNELHVYEYKLQAMRKVEMEKGCLLPLMKCCFPHVNSLISWRIGTEV